MIKRYFCAVPLSLGMLLYQDGKGSRAPIPWCAATATSASITGAAIAGAGAGGSASAKSAAAARSDAALCILRRGGWGYLQTRVLAQALR
ncbi:MAG: hypothetical protein H6669_15280 [Ardenticatenaceae bacterium]|nr:hypothetical protein [Ardenticatenaceae bacterium]